MRTILALALLSFVLLAGCAGEEELAGEQASAGEEVAASGEPGDSAAIAYYPVILDEEGFALEGVTLRAPVTIGFRTAREVTIMEESLPGLVVAVPGSTSFLSLEEARNYSFRCEPCGPGKERFTVTIV